MELFVDPDDRRSLVAQLYDQLRDAIVDGRLAAGTRLQPTRLVADTLGVARSTVTDAYARLVAEGLVEGRRGGGSVVASDLVPSPSRTRAATALRPSPDVAAIRPYGGRPAPPPRYDLRAGLVDPGLFPAGEWRRCLARAVAADDPEAFGRYGDPAGPPELRRALSGWVVQARGVAATPDQVVVTHGARHAVGLVARTLLEPGDLAAVEEPGYPPIADLLRSQGLRVVGVPVDADGLVVDRLPDEARLVHVTPSHQFPLGSVLSRERRRRLLDWACDHGAAVVEDDYDSEFRYTTRPLEPLHRLDRDGRVVYVGSFSKILSPALRLGFAVVPPGLAAATAELQKVADGGPSPVTGLALASFVEEGHLARHLRRARRMYTERHRVVWREVSRAVGSGLTALPTEAGLHLALVAPDAPPDGELHARAAARGLQISTLRRTYGFDEPRPGVVLGFGALATADVPRAVSLLQECLG